MRERVVAAGGTLEVGPLDGSGWRVRVDGVDRAAMGRDIVSSHGMVGYPTTLPGSLLDAAPVSRDAS